MCPRILSLLPVLQAVLLFSCRPPCTKDAEDPCAAPMTVVVQRVVDGDTLEVDPPIPLESGETDKVRLLCINTPETKEEIECYGEQAAAYVQDRVEGEEVTLYFDRDCAGVYGRALAYVMIGRSMLNQELAAGGYAVMIDDYFADYACCDEIQEAADLARTDGLGGWGSCTGTPWQ